ncbi:HNH endonuclease [Agarivorans sp. DSG3-1]|uniref:HNH endonuclease n=1 Tax=Agarivorans sp. DSG3-1 TaxID=3342249 RepID=UPI00398F396E
MFLQDVGKYYDQARGFEPFGPKVGQKDELLQFFNYECCFCGVGIDRKSLSQDHLIPMNKSALGLNAWGNVVPCCQSCNNEKQQESWKEFLAVKAGIEKPNKEQRINDFVLLKNYDPSLNLNEFADNLYEDVGQVAMTLINLRYRQAQKGIERLLESPVDKAAKHSQSSKKKVWMNGSTKTTQIGFINRNNQKNLGTRGIEGTDHGQSSYKIKCQITNCGHEYGSNGTDIFQRKCPNCQGGKPGISY